MGIGDIVECVGVEDVFFDSVDLFSAEDTSAVNEVWKKELRSVQERRDFFLSEMGFIESTSMSCSMEVGLRPMVESLSSSCLSSSTDCGDENVEFSVRESNSDANLVVDEQEHDQPIRHKMDNSNDIEASTSSCESLNKRVRHWWKAMSSIKRKGTSEKHEKFKMSRTKVHVNKKRVKELSVLFQVQEINAHNGIIWSMKFSPDGQYLASGGQDGVVRVWRVRSIDSCCDRFPNESITREKKVKIPVVIPDKMFQIEEQPLQEFYGHTGDVLDLSWSNSNYLLSSSTDKTVRLWHVGSDVCISTFLHSNYVTCIQFNPVDDGYFISGSIDGKVRIWGVSKKRVLDWADVRDAITAVCYQPDGYGFALGSLNGTCRFYETKDYLVELSAHIQIHSSKKSSNYRITGIQFLPEDSQRIMVMTEDSKLRIVDKEGRVCKYRGIPKSGGQMSATFSSNRSHIVSVGEDSSVYMWNHDDPFVSSPRHKNSNRSCEHFSSEGVSVALSWSGNETEATSSASCSSEHETASKGFSFSSLFSSKSSAIWPEDMLPIFNVSQEETKGVASSAWGLVILTANCDGMIRTFHNYGLPVKV